MSSFAKLAFDENVIELDLKEPETQRLILLVVKRGCQSATRLMVLMSC